MLADSKFDPGMGGGGGKEGLHCYESILTLVIDHVWKNSSY